MIRIPNTDKRFSITNNSDLFGNIWYTKNCNFDEEGYIKQSSRSVAVLTKEDATNFNTPASLGRSGDANFRVVNNNQPFKAELSSGLTFTLEQDTDSGAPGLSVDSRGVWFNSRWYVTTATGLYYKSGSTWTNTGISLTSGKTHAICVNKSAQTLLISDGNTVKQIDTSHSTSGLGQLTIPATYEVTHISYNNNTIGIATKLDDTVSTINEEAYFFIWNGATSQASQGFGIGSDSTMGLKAYKSSFALLARAGNLMVYNGGGFEIVASFPYYFKSLQVTDQNIGDNMDVDGDVIYINMSNYLNSFGERQEAYIENFPAGIWCFDPKVGLYHRYSSSLSKMKSTIALDSGVDISTNIITVGDAVVPETGEQVIFYYNPQSPIGGLMFGLVYYVIKVNSSSFKVATSYQNAIDGQSIDLTSTGSSINQLVFLTVNDFGQSLNLTRSGAVTSVGKNSLIYDHMVFGVELQDFDGTAPDPTLCITTPQFRNISSFVTTKGVSNNITDQYQKLYIKYRPLAENDRIIIKYKDKDILGLPVTTPQIPSFYTCTWTSSTTLTTNANLAAAKTYFDAQQLQSPIGELECEITAGAGAGQMSQITNITESSGTYTITLSDTIVGAVNTRNCDIIINNYKLLGEITYADTENYKEFPIALTSKWCQVKVIMDGVEITIEELQIINEKHLA